MSTFENAIYEYKNENENDNGKHKLIYSYFGLAIYIAQCLEETLSIMLWTNRICNKNIKTNQEVNDIIDMFENSKKTMGNFINEVKQNYNLPTNLNNELKEILNKRNYLVHKYFKLEIQKFYTELGQKEMLEYFSSFIDETQTINDKLKKNYKLYPDKLGMTEENINQMMESMIDKEREREKQNKTK